MYTEKNVGVESYNNCMLSGVKKNRSTYLVHMENMIIEMGITQL